MKCLKVGMLKEGKWICPESCVPGWGLWRAVAVKTGIKTSSIRKGGLVGTWIRLPDTLKTHVFNNSWLAVWHQSEGSSLLVELCLWAFDLYSLQREEDGGKPRGYSQCTPPSQFFKPFGLRSSILFSKLLFSTYSLWWNVLMLWCSDCFKLGIAPTKEDRAGECGFCAKHTEWASILNHSCHRKGTHWLRRTFRYPTCPDIVV